MSTHELPVSESCAHCPHLDSFHGSCTHALRQTVIRELATSESGTCPVFPRVRSDAMRKLVDDSLSSSR